MVLDLLIEVFVEAVDGGNHVGDCDDPAAREQQRRVGEDLEGAKRKGDISEVGAMKEKTEGNAMEHVRRELDDGEGWMDADEEEVVDEVSNQSSSARPLTHLQYVAQLLHELPLLLT